MGAKLGALITGLTRIGGMIGLIIIAFMVLATMADVTMRYFFHRPIAGVIEYCGILLPVTVFLGLAATQQASGHIGVTLFLHRLSPQGRAIQEIINLLLCLAFALALASQTWKGAMYAYAIKEYRYGVIGQDIPVWWAKIAMSIGFWMLSLQYLLDIGNKWSQWRSGRYAPKPTSPESQKGIL